MKGKFTSVDSKSLTPINICSTYKIVLTEEMINDSVAECATCDMISTEDYYSLNLVNFVFHPSESHPKINSKTNHALIQEAFNMKMLRSNVALFFNVNTNVIISLGKQ